MSYNMIDELSNKVSRVIDWSQSYEGSFDKTYPGVVDLVRRCLDNKEWFWRSSEVENLIYTSPEEVSFNFSNPEQLYNIFRDWLYDTYDSDSGYDEEDFHYYLKTQKSGFVDNTVKIPYKISEEKTIPQGMHLSKSFKFFISDEHSLRRIQDYYSSLIQQTKITGHLCISAHPLDFLSSSENTLNWRSCHALDGDFRAGNLSYMGDGATLVCYIKSKEDAILPRFPRDLPWNNKKWRMLIYVSSDKDMIYFGRQYPMQITGAREIVTDVMKKILAENFKWFEYSSNNWQVKNDYVVSMTSSSGQTLDLNDEENGCGQRSDFLILGNLAVSKRELFIEPKNSLHYNDVLYSSIDTRPHYAVMCNSENIPIVGRPTFRVGHRVKCPICGKEHLQDAESLICWKCYENPYNPEEEEKEEEKEISENVVIQQRGIHFDNITISEVNDVDLPFFVEENSNGTWSDS